MREIKMVVRFVNAFFGTVGCRLSETEGRISVVQAWRIARACALVG